MGAEYFTRQVAQRLGIAPADVGTAGLKDRHAVTRQWVSVPAAVEERLAQLDGDGIRVLRTGRHGNKLKLGHLHGNRFRILVRDLDPSVATLDVLPKLLDRIRALGMPNYYGPQRFGREGETLSSAWPSCAVKRPSCAAASCASWLYRRHSRPCSIITWPAAGLDGLLHKVLPGDVMAKVPFGGMFRAEDVGR